MTDNRFELTKLPDGSFINALHVVRLMERQVSAFAPERCAVLLSTGQEIELEASAAYIASMLSAALSNLRIEPPARTGNSGEEPSGSLALAAGLLAVAAS